MGTLRERTLAEALAAALPPDCGVDTLSQVVFDVVATRVPFAFACLATTDPATGLITSACKSRPLPVGDEEFAAAEYGGPDLNQLVDLARRPVPVGVLSIDSGGHPEACRRFREFMAPVFGFTDELRVVCRAGGVAWGAIGLYRGPGQPPFDRDDGALVAGVGELVADGLRRALFSHDGPGPGAGVGTPGAPAVLIVDTADQVTAMTAAVEQVVGELGGWDHGSLPATLLVVAASARRTGEPVSVQVRGRSGRWLALRGLTLTGQADPGGVVLTVDTAAQADVGQLRLAARGLTARERDVAQLVLQGASTKDISASLFLSPHTVQDHLKAIFVKLGVSSRREMVARLVLAADGSGPLP